MNRLLTILLLAAATTAHGQINNPPTSVNIVDSTATGRAVLTATNAAAAATAVGLGATNNVTFSNITATGTLAVSNSATFATNVTAPKFNGITSWGGGGNPGSLNMNAVDGIAGNIDTSATLGDASGGDIYTYAGSNSVASGGSILTYAGSVSGGSIITFDGGGSISTRGTGTLELGVSGTRTTFVGAATSNITVSLPQSSVTLVGYSTNSTLTAQTRTNLGLGATNDVTFSNITASGTLAVTGNVTMSGVNNTMPNATNAASASSLMTRSLSDVRYLGEMWHAWRMSAYNTTNIPVSVFKTAPCVLYTNGQSLFYVEAFLDPSKYAGKTVRVLAYCRVDSTNGGNVQGAGRITYLTNTAGGPDPNFPLTVGGQAHGVIGVFTNVNTDVFPVATSTNQYLIFTSNVGTIPTNATLMIASFGFNRATNLTTFTNGNLYMQAVEVVVENP